MRLARFLEENKGEIQQRWINRVLDGYAADASAIFKREQDRFANPVGYSTRHTLSAVYSLLFDQPDSEPNMEQIRNELATFVKIRAVQTFTPASAVLFIFDLKTVVRQFVGQERNLVVIAAEWERFYDIVDRVALVVFDLYMASRERLFQTQINEIKSMNYMHTQHGCSASRLADKIPGLTVNP
ncbi:MAG: hypothetical protein EYX74_05735 [Desulfobulbaceae bacterium]|nr:MAG: hypothetical protein EYX74_05735 [Desulfobulbaceae bacterium]